MPGWEALLEEHFQWRDVRPVRREERPLHRDFAGVAAVGPCPFVLVEAHCAEGLL